MTIGYVARRRFRREDAGWSNYADFSGLHHVSELVTLDVPLCGNVISALTVEDWKHNLPEEDVFCFWDLDYLLSRVDGVPDCQILAVAKNPEEQPILVDSRFQFVGYDLVETDGNISALTNCGGFDNTFQANDLSEHGLIPTLDKAREVNDLLRENYPEDHHAFCDIWAIWRMTGD